MFQARLGVWRFWNLLEASPAVLGLGFACDGRGQGARERHIAHRERGSVSGAATLAAVFVAYGLLASRLERSLISAPIFFVAVGLALGPSGSGTLPVGLESETTLVITELTLGVLLFADAATVRLA